MTLWSAATAAAPLRLPGRRPSPPASNARWTQYDGAGWLLLPPPPGAALAAGGLMLIVGPVVVLLVPGPSANHQTAARIRSTIRMPRITPVLLPLAPRSTTTVLSSGGS